MRRKQTDERDKHARSRTGAGLVKADIRHGLCVNSCRVLRPSDYPQSGNAFAMPPPVDHRVLNNLFRPSLLAWRVKHLAEKAARVRKPEATIPVLPEENKKTTQ